MPPTVTFIVPCYNLAHLLPECLDSILKQTFTDFEILVMDDCSPDNTPQVVRSYSDPRIIHVRNEPNLGHLRNYNKGITMARGKYIWLVSADDCLYKTYALERYVRTMESNPSVGYVFSPAMDLRDGRVTGIVEWTAHGGQDRIFANRSLLPSLIEGNGIAAPAGMVRRECYQKVGSFPLELPHAGDWYLWLAFALYYDVAYLAEPMVCYRWHDQGMSKAIRRVDESFPYDDAERVRWRFKDMAAGVGASDLVNLCKEGITTRHAIRIAAKLYDGSPIGLPAEECLRRIAEHAVSEAERKDLCARLYCALADQAYRRRKSGDSLRYYREALRLRSVWPSVWAKTILLYAGPLGRSLRTRSTTATNLPVTCE